jgi:hypothetical protein
MVADIMFAFLGVVLSIEASKTKEQKNSSMSFSVALGGLAIGLGIILSAKVLRASLYLIQSFLAPPIFNNLHKRYGIFVLWDSLIHLTYVLSFVILICGAFALVVNNETPVTVEFWFISLLVIICTLCFDLMVLQSTLSSLQNNWILRGCKYLLSSHIYLSPRNELCDKIRDKNNAPKKNSRLQSAVTSLKLFKNRPKIGMSQVSEHDPLRQPSLNSLIQSKGRGSSLIIGALRSQNSLRKKKLLNK